MQVTPECDVNDPAQAYCNEQYLLNIVHWFTGELDTDGDGIIDKEDNCPDTWDPQNNEDACDDTERLCAVNPPTHYWEGMGEDQCPSGYTGYIIGSGPNKQTFRYCNLDIDASTRADYFNYMLPSEGIWECEEDCADGYPHPDGPGVAGDGPLARRIARRTSVPWRWYMYACQE
jgi:hypothetical protein